MEITRQEQEGVVVLALKGRLDGVSAAGAQETLDACIQQGQRKLLLDLSGLEYLSSAGIRVILATAKALDALGGKMVLCAMRGYVKEVFDISGFSALIPTADTVASGLKSFA